MVNNYLLFVFKMYGVTFKGLKLYTFENDITCWLYSSLMRTGWWQHNPKALNMPSPELRRKSLLLSLSQLSGINLLQWFCDVQTCKDEIYNIKELSINYHRIQKIHLLLIQLSGEKTCNIDFLNNLFTWFIYTLYFKRGNCCVDWNFKSKFLHSVQVWYYIIRIKREAQVRDIF